MLFRSIEALCTAAVALGIGSSRAAALALRVARSAAALAGREAVDEADLAVAGRLVLAPRACALPPTTQGDGDAEQPGEAGAAPPESAPADGDETPQQIQGRKSKKRDRHSFTSWKSGVNVVCAGAL